MATDNWGQTIPSWVEDNSYECATRQTIVQNDGHPKTQTQAQFNKFMKESGDGYIYGLRGGKVKDNNWMDGKFIEDSQRTYTNVDDIAQKDEMIAKYGAAPDGNPKATLSFVKGLDANDTSNWGSVTWLNNSGLDVYTSPYTYWNGSTEVAKAEGSSDTFDKVTVDIYWKSISDYKKVITGEINPIATVSKRVTSDGTNDDKVMNQTNAVDISPNDNEVELEDFGRGEDYKFKLVCSNDFLVSGAAMKYKREWLKGGDHADADFTNKFLIANGMARIACLDTWVTHSCPSLGQPRTTKNVLNFVGGSRVETTLQDIDGAAFSLPAGHPMIQHSATSDVKWKEFWQEQDDAGAFSNSNKALYQAIKSDIYN